MILKVALVLPQIFVLYLKNISLDKLRIQIVHKQQKGFEPQSKTVVSSFYQTRYNQGEQKS